MKYAWEQLTIHLLGSCTKVQCPSQKSLSLLVVKHCLGGDCVPHSGTAKWRIPQIWYYFSTVPGCRNTILVQLHRTVLALPPNPINCCGLTHMTLAGLKLSAPNGICHVIGKFMTHLCLFQKIFHSYCTSGGWQNGKQNKASQCLSLIFKTFDDIVI